MLLLRRYRTSFSLPKEKKKKDYDLTWDYKGPQRSDFFGSQKDWCQTLITKINQCSAQINKESLIGGATVIECGTNLEHVFDDIEYYHSEEKQLGGRYSVIFKKELQSTIKIYNHKKPELIRTVKVKGVKEDFVVGTNNNTRKRLLLCKKRKQKL